ncbi:hypothetical protein F53441_3230 [Fusarium austroafricanum]|uniref:BHLH domain-containing protein n=1 Tax=Fusarium austroafricanum TaxID=2364996 RepID=A0A8H4P067_9HYPO|nr:hypothetical protein F53441_3230 [Fusarium austroafricanum]
MADSRAKKTPPKRKGRARPLPPDVTARNLAIEKKRREELKEDFLTLARLLPNLVNARRLSKALIVNKSIEYVRQQLLLCLLASGDMQELVDQNRQLVLEVNDLRTRVGGLSMPLAQAKPITQAMTQLAQTKDQLCGLFPAGFGDNWAEEYSQTQQTTRVTDLLPSCAPTVQQTQANFTPDSMQSSLGSTNALLPATVEQEPQKSFGTGLDTMTEPSFPGINLIGAGDSYLDDQMLANMWAQEIGLGSNWIGYPSRSEISALMQNGIGENEMQSFN